MKKLLAALIACLFIASAFCGCSDPLSSSSTQTTSESEATADEAEKTTANKTYADSFKDLRTYMKDKGYLTSDVIKNANSTELPDVDGIDYKYGYEIIGAVKGEKYSNNGVVIELYEFEEGKQNDYVDSVKQNGTFTLYDKEITAYLTNNDKYMMIYTDKSVKDGDTSSDAYKNMMKAVKAFMAFNPTK